MRSETLLGLRGKDCATALLAGRDLTFHRVGRTYNRTVTTVVLDGRDLGDELVAHGSGGLVAARTAKAGLVPSGKDMGLIEPRVDRAR